MEQEAKTGPTDAYNVAYVIHILLGAANLLPWNAFITAVDYFSYLHPTQHIDKVFSVAYMTSSLPVLLLMIGWGRWGRLPSFRCRMNLGLTLFLLTLLAQPVLDWLGPKVSRDTAYVVIVVVVVICGLTDGLIGGSLIGSAGKLPERYMQAIYAGTASSGVLVSILRIITKASLPQTPHGLRTSSHVYFLVSTFIMLGCIVCCNVVDRLPVIRHYQDKISLAPKSHIPQTTSTNALHNVSERTKFWAVAKKIRWSAFGIFAIYIVTLSIFPGYITENVKSEVFRDWYPIFLITIYNITDLVGKSLPAVCMLNSRGKACWGCIVRLILYPLFTGCLHGPRWLRTEGPVVFLTAILGLSNGYLTSILMILVPKSVPISEAETAGIVMVLFLGMGLVGGSVLGWLWII